MAMMVIKQSTTTVADVTTYAVESTIARTNLHAAGPGSAGDQVKNHTIERKTKSVGHSDPSLLFSTHLSSRSI